MYLLVVGDVGTAQNLGLWGSLGLAPQKVQLLGHNGKASRLHQVQARIRHKVAGAKKVEQPLPNVSGASNRHESVIFVARTTAPGICAKINLHLVARLLQDTLEVLADDGSEHMPTKQQLLIHERVGVVRGAPPAHESVELP